MKTLTMHGMIDRRILVNFTADPTVVAKLLPTPFRPKIYKGKAIVGICLIRLKDVRPKGLPSFLGVSSENGAHRIAVEWDDTDGVQEGVYVARRDTSLRLNALVGGRLFSGKHHLAAFNVQENNDYYQIGFKSADNTSIAIEAKETATFNANSIFETLDNASAFFQKGSVGYSPNGSKFDGLRLNAYNWQVKPLEVFKVQSSFFDNDAIFPNGSITFDNALLMTKIEHDWESVADK